MRRGQAGCGAFRLGRVWGRTVTGSRAGACRLRRVGRRCLAPVGQGALRGCVFDAVCPCGAKALLSMARRIMGLSREKVFAGRFALERWSGGAPGGRKHAVLRSMRPPSSRNHPAGERRALPAPAQGSRPLRIPFWEAASIFPSPVPQNAADASPCSWACRRLCARPPQAERSAAHPPPARGADARRIRANGLGRRHCRPRLPASAWAVVLVSAWPR